MSTKANSHYSVTLADIQGARAILTRHLEPSPLLYSEKLSRAHRCEVYLKLESLQPIGSFKIRGALNKISQLSPRERRKGVIAASMGNHAQGVAWASHHLGVKATIVMPLGAPIMKIENTERLGAQVVLEGRTFDEAVAIATGISKKTGKILIPAFDDPAIIAGQGTVALEILDQLPDVDVVIGAMGGGGLMAGAAIAFQGLKSNVRIIGCQASGSSSLTESLKKGRIVVNPVINTFADGIAIGKSSEPIRKILNKALSEYYIADDEEIAAAVLHLMENAKVVAEGAGAVPLAILERISKKLKGKKVVLIVSGGNIDVNVLSRIIERGLIRAGRRLRLNVTISDRPGSLSRLTLQIAREGASVIQAIHDRSEPGTRIDQTELALTLETRSQAHSKSVIKALRSNVIRLELVR